MRSLVFTLFCCSLFAQTPQRAIGAISSDGPAPASVKPEDKCVIEGTVVNALTGEPLKKAHLSLRPMGQVNGVPYGTVTDNAGRFTIDDVDPGRYVFSASRSGFVSQPYSPQGAKRSTTLTLGNGQHLREITFKLTPQGVIAGRILDEDGEPMEYVSVQPMLYSYQRGKRQLQQVGGSNTDDRGEFRIHGLRPGKYIVSASYQSRGMTTGPPERTVGSAQAVQAAEEGYAITYYPNTTKPESASQIEVAPGAQIQGLTMTLSRTKTVRIKGRVIAAFTDSSTIRRTNISLSPRDNSVFLYTPGMFARVLDGKGNFAMRGVAPGSYLLSADSMEDGKRYSARLPIEVDTSNLEDIELRPVPPAELTGKVVVEENGKLTGTLSVFLQPKLNVPMMGGVAPGQVKDDLSFKLTNVGPDPYDVSVFGLPEGFYLKSIRLGNQDVIETGLDFTQGVVAEPLTITINPNGAQIEGTVQNAKDENATGATVTLIPDVSHRSIGWMYQRANTDQNGHFTIKGVRPGDYTIFAWEEIEDGAYQDPDFLKPHESDGTAVSLKQGGHETVQLKAVPAESSASEKASQ